MKTYFIRAGQNSKATMEALKQAVLEHENIQEFDTVFSLSYDREDQFFIKTPEAICWGRVFGSAAGYREVTDLAREIQRLSSTFNLEVKPFIFFQDLTSGHGLLKALPGRPRCYEYSFLRSGSGSALALKDLSQMSAKVLPPTVSAEGNSMMPAETSRVSSSYRLSRSEINELIEISLQLKRMTE
jgi:hypothetical protein